MAHQIPTPGLQPRPTRDQALSELVAALDDLTPEQQYQLRLVLISCFEARGRAARNELRPIDPQHAWPKMLRFNSAVLDLLN